MKRLFCSCVFLSLFFWGNKLTAQKVSSKKNFIGTLKNYRNNDTLFKTKQGHLFNLRFVADEEEMLARSATVDCSTNNFAGTDRKNCKTSIALAPVKTIGFKQLLRSLKPDSVMIANPNITKAPANPRVSDENHNFKLSGVFLFALKRESDNDYHIIIGDKSGAFMNVEISGLPAPGTAAFQKLSAARTAVDAYFGKPNCNTGGYATFPQGIKINLTGSTFYDIDHAPGDVGPAGFKPKTSWEIHPVTAIAFLQ